jgi:hypothetical protein
MDTPGKRVPDERPDPTKLRLNLGHFDLRDTRTLEEQRPASLKESARRTGRAREVGEKGRG